MRIAPAHQVERGATLPEYALIVALLGVVILGAIGAIQSQAGDRMETSSDQIGEPFLPNPSPSSPTPTGPTPTTVPLTTTTTVATTTTTAPTTTTTVATTTTAAPTTTTTAAPTTTTTRAPVADVTCSDNRTCTFTLSNAPTGTTYVWTVSSPSSSGSGTGSSYLANISSGSKTVTVRFTIPGGQTFQQSVTCGGGNSPCNPS